jgi:MinD-like ATPase involved in chromosome partitioning or flagellar assembly
MQQSSLQNVIQITNIPHLDVITSGNAEQPIGHLVATSRTKDIIDELRMHYDAVIVDTPEVGEYIDAIPFMKWSDLNLYVVKADSDRDQLIANAEMVKEEYRLEEVHFVVNAMKEKRNHTGFLSPKKSKTIKSKQNAPQLTNLFMW